MRHHAAKHLFASRTGCPVTDHEPEPERAPHRGAPFEVMLAESLRLRRVLRHDADLVVHDLEEPALDVEAGTRAEP